MKVLMTKKQVCECINRKNVISENVVTTNAELAKAEKSVDKHPSDEQAVAGNYKKGHVTINGFDITIENPKGSNRSGVDKDGNRWSVKMANTYGYYKRTTASDGDSVDVFLGDDLESEKIFVVDQVDENGDFDEYKIIMCHNGSIQTAKKLYLNNYSKGWKGCGNITEVDIDSFRKWLYSGTKRIKPFSEYEEIKNKKG